MSAPEKSYLSAGLANLSPWGSRSSTPKTTASGEGGGHEQQKGGDHILSHRHRLSLREYPSDCPTLAVRWFYAVDVAKRKPRLRGQPVKETKPPPAPKKYVPFSAKDSRSIEARYQTLGAEEDARTDVSQTAHQAGAEEHDYQMKASAIPKPQRQISAASKQISVPVNEDYLFDVNIEERELAPAYWLGPVYEVRRGTWFHQEGSTLRPCDENLATQLEEGYLKTKPFRYAAQTRSASQPRTSSIKDQGDDAEALKASEAIAQYPSDDLDVQGKEDRREARSTTNDPPKSPAQPQTHRLFGTYMNSMVTYQDAKAAWILTDDFLSRMSTTVYQRFAGGGYLGGMKVVRGYSEPKKAKETKPEGEKKVDTNPTASDNGGATQSTGDKDEGYSKGSSPVPDVTMADSSSSPVAETTSQSRRQALERQMSTLVTSADAEDPQKQEEEARRRDEKEIQDDYRDDEGEDQARDIEHLILVTHGIGQRLGLRMESVNFVHDVNVLRKTLKSVYDSSADLQALNTEVGKLPRNCRVQVLPVCWRHLLDFPKQRLGQSEREHDLGDLELVQDEDKYPSLEDITVQGVPAVRSLITDLALDILLYQSAYKEHISHIVQGECNRIFKLFLERNPTFKGHVSLMGHSLGSAILFDILCDQQDRPKRKGLTGEQRSSHRNQKESARRVSNKTDLELDFDVDAFFCVGSPIGLFQMLKGGTIAARQKILPLESPRNPDLVHNPTVSRSFSTSNDTADESALSSLPVIVSSPKCAQLFNIFHPTDPISYRLEPLISSAMSSLKPQLLPYTKKGIFGAPMGQGLSGIGARVGQSVSGLWSSLSSGIASSILNRSLGISGEDLKAELPTEPPLSIGAGTNISGGSVIPTSLTSAEIRAAGLGDDKKRKLGGDTAGTESTNEHPPTLIDAGLETLYSGFQKRRKSHQADEARDLGDSPEWQALEDRARKLGKEEQKVRALNPNGRVDYSIQEGVFDISLIASIASHLSYWADEDVSHFMISQLLSSHRVLQRGHQGGLQPGSARLKQV